MTTMNSVSIGEAKDMLLAVIGDGFRRGIVPQNVMLHGSPGTGKSSIVFQVADYLAEELGRPVEVIDVRLSCVESSEVQGIPHNAETGEFDIITTPDGQEVQIMKKVMAHSTPEWFPKGTEKFYILFLDELTNCSVSVQHAAYRILLDRSIQNGSVLPETCAIVAAGNLKSDKTGAKSLLAAAANRIGVHLKIDRDRAFDSFLEYAMNKGFERELVGYLNWRKASLYNNDGHDEAFATPRSWEFVDNHLKNESLRNNERLLDIAIAGAVGSAMAVDFSGYREYQTRLPNFRKIKDGEETYEFPEGEDGLKFAVTTSLAFELVDSLQVEDKKQAEKEINNLECILEGIPSEMAIVLFRTMAFDKKIVTKLFSFETLKKYYSSVAKKIQNL